MHTTLQQPKFTSKTLHNLKVFLHRSSLTHIKRTNVQSTQTYEVMEKLTHIYTQCLTNHTQWLWLVNITSEHFKRPEKYLEGVICNAQQSWMRCTPSSGQRWWIMHLTKGKLDHRSNSVRKFCKILLNVPTSFTTSCNVAEIQKTFEMFLKRMLLSVNCLQIAQSC